MPYELDVRRLIDAPVELVSRARTDIDIQREIAKANDGSAKLSGEIRVGGKRVEEWQQGDRTCRVTQTYLEIGPDRVYSELLELPPSPVYESTITETLTPQDGKTLFWFHVEGFPTEQERDIHRKGYNIVLDRLEAWREATRG